MESGGYLVGENFALLIGDGLAIHGKRVFRMVAHAMEEAIGIGGDSRRSQRNQRTHRRGRAFQRHFVKQIAIYVCVKRGIGSQPGQRLRLPPLQFSVEPLNFKPIFRFTGNDRANVNILRIGSESLDADGEVVGIERNVGNGESARAVSGDRADHNR